MRGSCNSLRSVLEGFWFRSWTKLGGAISGKDVISIFCSEDAGECADAAR
jgi:hypothetical protein